MSVDGTNLKVEFACVTARMTRIAVNAFMESLDLVVTAMRDLGEYCAENER
jgi:Transcription factor Pcc1